MGFLDSVKAGLLAAAGVDHYAMQRRDEGRKLNVRYDWPSPAISPSELASLIQDGFTVAQEVMFSSFQAVAAAARNIQDDETVLVIWKAWADAALPKLDYSGDKFQEILRAADEGPSNSMRRLLREARDTVRISCLSAVERIASADDLSNLNAGFEELVAATKRWTMVWARIEALNDSLNLVSLLREEHGRVRPWSRYWRW
jgi:hypothetical protein